MSLFLASGVIKFGRQVLPAAVAAVALVVCPSPLAAQPGPFTGPYIGIEVGRQHLIGGALVDAIDTLRDDSRVVASGVAGLRGQIGPIVIGGEFGIGRTNGDLELDEPARDLRVSYATSGQWHWALTAGPTLGAKTLLYAYVSEVTRQFDVTVVHHGASTTQSDEQGLLRYGVGIEHRLRGPMHVRAALGSSRADFGGRPTNIAIGRRLDVSVGVLLQF